MFFSLWYRKYLKHKRLLLVLMTQNKDGKILWYKNKIKGVAWVEMLTKYVGPNSARSVFKANYWSLSLAVDIFYKIKR